MELNDDKKPNRADQWVKEHSVAIELIVLVLASCQLIKYILGDLNVIALETPPVRYFMVIVLILGSSVTLIQSFRKRRKGEE